MKCIYGEKRSCIHNYSFTAAPHKHIYDHSNVCRQMWDFMTPSWLPLIWSYLLMYLVSENKSLVSRSRITFTQWMHLACCPVEMQSVWRSASLATGSVCCGRNIQSAPTASCLQCRPSLSHGPQSLCPEKQLQRPAGGRRQLTVASTCIGE